MNLINKSIATSLLLVPVTVFACFPAKVSLQQRVAAAQQIFVGVVKEVSPEDQNNESQNVINAVSQPTKAYSLKVSVTEVLKGNKNQLTVQPKILNCGSGQAELNDKVIVYLSDGFWYTSQFEQQNYSKLLKLTNPE